MAIIFSNRQMAECMWFVSLKGYDSVSSWNAYLLSQSLPQDCTTANIGSSTYPYRSWAAVPADSRSISGDKVAVGLGRWGSDIQRSTWTKSMIWVGMTGAIIDCSLLTAIPFKFLSVPETLSNISVINGEMYIFTVSQQSMSLYIDNTTFDYLNIGAGLSSAFVGVLYLTNVIVEGLSEISVDANKYTLIAKSCYINADVNLSAYAPFSLLMSTITKKFIAKSYYCCFTDVASGVGVASLYNIKTDPLFNNKNIGDFTLSSASPCLYRGKNGKHIGPLGEARTINPNSVEFTEPNAIYSKYDAINNDLEKTSYDIEGVTFYQLVLRSGLYSGTVETGWVDFGKVREIDSLRFIANVFYDTNNNYEQAPTPDLDNLIIKYKAALTEAEKAGVSWIDTEWNSDKQAINARFMKLLITVTSSVPAP